MVYGVILEKTGQKCMCGVAVYSVVYGERVRSGYGEYMV